MKAKVITRLIKNGGGIQVPTRLIIHAMGQYIVISESDSRYYKGKGKDMPVGFYHASEFLERAGLSVHFLVEPNGDLMKLRETTDIAWHAKGHNTNTVGIEVLIEAKWNYSTFKKVMLKEEDWAKQAQYDSLVEISNDIIEYFDMDKDKGVLKHSDLNTKEHPNRKLDPGKGFRWKYYKKQLT